MNKEDEEVFNSYIRPFFIERGLPSSDSFLREITELFIDASQMIVHYRKEQSIANTSDVNQNSKKEKTEADEAEKVNQAKKYRRSRDIGKRTNRDSRGIM